jgi:hypothetical protein
MTAATTFNSVWRRIELKFCHFTILFLLNIFSSIGVQQLLKNDSGRFGSEQLILAVKSLL